MRKQLILGFVTLTLAAIIILGTISVTRAYTSSSDVVFIPDANCLHGGTLPQTDPAFAAFTFSTMAWTDVSSTNLDLYDTVVLVVETTIIPLNASQQTDLINWVSNGGKLIIYDSETIPGVDYSWFPYPFTTENPGAMGYDSGAITYMEDNTLGSTNPVSSYYINTTGVPLGQWEDVVGDCNTFVTYDSHWCGHIRAQNYFSYPPSPGYDGSADSWVHAYAQYGGGLFIYNGFDLDPLSIETEPSTTGVGNLAKIWLQELQQPWGADYNLPCSTPIIVPVGGFILAPGTPLFYIAIAAIAATAVMMATIFKKQTIKHL